MSTSLSVYYLSSLFVLLLNANLSLAALTLPTAAICAGYDSIEGSLPDEAIALAKALGIDAQQFCAGVVRETMSSAAPAVTSMAESTSIQAFSSVTEPPSSTSTAYSIASSIPTSTSQSSLDALTRQTSAAASSFAPSSISEASLSTAPTLAASPSDSTTASAPGPATTSSAPPATSGLSKTHIILLATILSVVLLLLLLAFAFLLFHRRQKTYDRRRDSQRYLLHSSFSSREEKPFYRVASMLPVDRPGGGMGEESREVGADGLTTLPVRSDRTIRPRAALTRERTRERSSLGVLLAGERDGSRSTSRPGTDSTPASGGSSIVRGTPPVGDVQGCETSTSTPSIPPTTNMTIAREGTMKKILRRSRQLSSFSSPNNKNNNNNNTPSSFSPFSDRNRSSSPLQDDASTLRWDPLPPLPDAPAPTAASPFAPSSFAVGRSPFSSAYGGGAEGGWWGLARSPSVQRSMAESSHSEHFYYLQGWGGSAEGGLRAVNGDDRPDEGATSDEDEQTVKGLGWRGSDCNTFGRRRSSLPDGFRDFNPSSIDPSHLPDSTNVNSSNPSGLASLTPLLPQTDYSPSAFSQTQFPTYSPSAAYSDDGDEELSLHRPPSGKAVEILARNISVESGNPLSGGGGASPTTAASPFGGLGGKGGGGGGEEEEGWYRRKRSSRRREHEM